MTRARLAALAAEHRQVRARITAFTRARSGGRPAIGAVKELLRYVAGPLATHMLAEERELFPALVAATPELGYALEPLRADHAELRDVCIALRGWLEATTRAGREEQLGVITRDLCDLLLLHIEREERTAYAWAGRGPGSRRAPARGGRAARGPA